MYLKNYNILKYCLFYELVSLTLVIRSCKIRIHILFLCAQTQFFLTIETESTTSWEPISSSTTMEPNQNTLQVLEEAGDFTTFIDFVKHLKLEDYILRENITIFAPTDQAFAEFTKEMQEKDGMEDLELEEIFSPAQQRNMILRHVIYQSISTDYFDNTNGSLDTMNGESIELVNFVL